MTRLVLILSLILTGCLEHPEDLEQKQSGFWLRDHMECGINAGYLYCRYPGYPDPFVDPSRGICYWLDGSCQCNTVDDKTADELCQSLGPAQP